MAKVCALSTALITAQDLYVRLTDHSGMTVAVYCERKTTKQQQQFMHENLNSCCLTVLKKI